MADKPIGLLPSMRADARRVEKFSYPVPFGTVVQRIAKARRLKIGHSSAYLCRENESLHAQLKSTIYRAYGADRDYTTLPGTTAPMYRLLVSHRSQSPPSWVCNRSLIKTCQSMALALAPAVVPPCPGCRRAILRPQPGPGLPSPRLELRHRTIP